MLEEDIVLMQEAYADVCKLIKWFNSNLPSGKNWSYSGALEKSQKFKEACGKLEKLTKKVDEGMAILSPDTQQYLLDKHKGKSNE